MLVCEWNESTRPHVLQKYYYIIRDTGKIFLFLISCIIVCMYINIYVCSLPTIVMQYVFLVLYFFCSGSRNISSNTQKISNKHYMHMMRMISFDQIYLCVLAFRYMCSIYIYLCSSTSNMNQR